MRSAIAELVYKIRELEAELEADLAEKSREWHYRFEAKRIRFEREVQAHHRQLKESIPRFIRTGRLRNLLTAPIIYSMILPLAVLDLWFTVYQTLCFPVYESPRVRRSQYLIIDRHHLSYLNGVEKLNCVYCGYANGLLAYVREIAARTEHYWCPIKHATRVIAPHHPYRLFVDYGDARGYKQELPRLRSAYGDVADPAQTARRKKEE